MIREGRENLIKMNKDGNVILQKQSQSLDVVNAQINGHLVVLFFSL